MGKISEWIADKIGILNIKLYNTNEDLIMYGVNKELKRAKKKGK